MTRFDQFDEVVIATSRFADRGVPEGSRAVVLDVYGDGGYELQIFDASGETIGLFAVSGADLAAAAVQPPARGAFS